MNYYVEINKNTQTTNCVKQIKKFNSFEEANNYFKNALMELEPMDKGFIELGEEKIIYQFIHPNKMKSIKIEKDNLKKNNSFIQDYLISNLNSEYFYLKILKLRLEKTKIAF